MKINLAKTAGFCFGVRRAINITLDAARKHKKIYMLGNIVHNEDVVRDIRQRGVKKINRLTEGKNKTLLIRAHGASRAVYQEARRLGYKIIDATCPMVKEIHLIVKNAETNGRFIVVIGDKKHDEVRGILGQSDGKGMVIDAAENIPLSRIKRIRRACVVVQSTQDIEKVNQVVAVFKRYIPDLKFFNTICGTTRARQEEIKSMPLENDLILIIGSKTSANTKRLYQISKSINKRSYWIQNAKEIKPAWFRKVKSVGITAGASTPDYTTRAVIGRVRKITA